MLSEKDVIKERPGTMEGRDSLGCSKRQIMSTMHVSGG